MKLNGLAPKTYDSSAPAKHTAPPPAASGATTDRVQPSARARMSASRKSSSATADRQACAALPSPTHEAMCTAPSSEATTGSATAKAHPREMHGASDGLRSLEIAAAERSSKRHPDCRSSAAAKHVDSAHRAASPISVAETMLAELRVCLEGGCFCGWSRCVVMRRVTGPPE